MARFRVEGFGGREGVSPRADGGNPTKGAWIANAYNLRSATPRLIMVPSYRFLQVQEDRIPSFRGVGENVDSHPDYSGFQDGLVGWPGIADEKNGWGARIVAIRCQVVAIRCQAVDSGASNASTVWRQVATA